MAAGATYVSIASNTLSSSAASVTFSSIPGTYTDLVVVVAGTFTTGSTNNVNFQFNGDTASNYSFLRLLGDGSAASSYRVSDVQIDIGLLSSTAQSNTVANIQNYSNTTTYKTAIGRGNTPEYVQASLGAWRNTAAITSVTILSAATFASGTTFSLYGIAAA